MEVVIDKQRGREKQLFETCQRNGVEFRWPDKEKTDEQRACRRRNCKKTAKMQDSVEDEPKWIMNLQY